MSDADFARKFIVNSEPVIGKAKCERLSQLMSFDQAPALDALYEWQRSRDRFQGAAGSTRRKNEGV